MKRPLDPLRSIKTKLGVVIVAAVGVTVVVFTIGVRLHVPTYVLALIAGSLALGMVQFLARGMTSPLRQMVAASLAMSEGDYSRRVPESSRDEVGDLARAFNRMAADLAETDRIRRDLVANVSHDLRTPLTSLRATLENMIDGVTGTGEESLRKMLAQVERLGGLVSQLLDLSRLESGVVPLEPVDLSLQELVSSAVDDLGMDASRVELQVVDHRFSADRERLHQMMSNLLHNALRHSPPGEPVVVSAAPDGERIVIAVADRGPGLAPGEETKVFERFYRGDEARSGDEGGAGLGLAIARWIVDLHGGAIRAERNEPNGCRMVVALPEASR